MKRLEQMKECLIACVQNQINGHLDQVDTKELGEAIDMIKDLEEAIYYCTITKAMHESDEEHGNGNGNGHHEENRMYNKVYYRYEDYPENGYENGARMMPYENGNPHKGKRYNYVPMEDNGYERDYREGSSPMYRRMYMESKEMNQDSAKNMQDLENYVHELSKDIMDMIENSTAEEKQMLRQKITTLAAKIK